MKTINANQPAFKHEFYAIALKAEGDNKKVNGRPLHANLFFNSPYQIIDWDIQLDWRGWYIIFGKEFLGMNPANRNFIIDFPFFKLDKAITFTLPSADERFADSLFQKIFEEYHSDDNDKFSFIQNYTQLLLLLTKRCFDRQPLSDPNGMENRTADILLVSRFQTLVDTLTVNQNAGTELRLPSFYAEKLTVHANHLNAVVKRITGKTASQVIHDQVVAAAKSLLHQTDVSIKEVAYQLHFAEPTHFSSFFKKETGVTPRQFRESLTL